MLFQMLIFEAVSPGWSPLSILAGAAIVMVLLPPTMPAMIGMYQGVLVGAFLPLRSRRAFRCPMP